MSKILSFVVPAYNSERCLDTCLSSFVKDSVFDKLEVIVVNDGSTDKTPDIVKEYIGRYGDVFKLINQENKGHGGAINTGISAASGRFVKVIDADDWVETENLERFISLLEDCDADVVLTHHYTRNITTGEVKKWKSYPERFGVSYTFSQIMSSWKSFDRSLTFHGVTYNLEFYKKYGIKLSEHVFYEDHEYATVPCCFARSIVPFDLFVYDYRIGDITQSVSDENQLKRSSHTHVVIEKLAREYKRLEPFLDEGGKSYYRMKIQGLILSYLVTVLLVQKDKKRGRVQAKSLMTQFEEEIPEVYALAKKQYGVFLKMNYLHISKKMWDAILCSGIYNRLRGNHSFD
ncbi:MAG: glycosyltransferase family 2 protein [Ruminococcus sp.]|nr:glycosyltransferase family 2 protein [Ruminococcus sp.]